MQRLDTSSVEQHFDHSLLTLDSEPEELRNHFRQLSPPSEMPCCIFHTGEVASAAYPTAEQPTSFSSCGMGGDEGYPSYRRSAIIPIWYWHRESLPYLQKEEFFTSYVVFDLLLASEIRSHVDGH